MTSAYSWVGIYLSVGTVLVCAYLVWCAAREVRRGSGSSPRGKLHTALEPWPREGEGGWTPDVEPWRPADTGGWQEELDESWSPDDETGGGTPLWK